MRNSIYEGITSSARKKSKKIAVLVDPDKVDMSALQHITELINLNGVDYVFVGGSLLTRDFMGQCIDFLKKNTLAPVLLFPGNALQINNSADGILLLSLISGRNPELLIGNHVIAAPLLRNAGIEIIPTGYMLVESGKLTSVEYMSNTTPIPDDKTDIAMCTAMAGEMLGLKMIYMDAGSGANKPISSQIIKKVKENIQIPLITGGGIASAKQACTAWSSGSDIIVVGNALEKHPDFIEQLCHERDIFNNINA